MANPREITPKEEVEKRRRAWALNPRYRVGDQVLFPALSSEGKGVMLVGIVAEVLDNRCRIETPSSKKWWGWYRPSLLRSYKRKLAGKHENPRTGNRHKGTMPLKVKSPVKPNTGGISSVSRVNYLPCPSCRTYNPVSRVNVYLKCYICGVALRKVNVRRK